MTHFLTKYTLTVIFCCVTVGKSELELVWAPAVRLDNLVWKPVPPSSDYFIVGQFVDRDQNETSTNTAEAKIPVARSINGRNELKAPLKFKKITTQNKNVTFWKMICPLGYVAMSGIATRKSPSGSQVQPDVERYRCVRQNLTKPSELFYHFLGNGKYGFYKMPVEGNLVGSFYKIERPTGSLPKIIGYTFIQTPDQYTTSKPTTTETSKTTSLKTSTRQVTTSSTTKSTAMPNELQLMKNRSLLIIIVVSVVVVTLLILVWLVVCFNMKTRPKSKAPITHTMTTEASDFVYHEAAPAPPDGKFQRPEREMRINVLYEEAKQNDVHGYVTANTPEQPITVVNPLYEPTIPSNAI